MSPISWLVAFLVLLLIEIATLGLVTIWFAGACLIAMVASALGAPLWMQLAVFVVVSVVLFVFTRPIAMKYFNKSREKTNVENVIGKCAIVTETIDNLRETGSVKLNGLDWTARSAEEALVIEKDTKVEILEVKGVKLICKPV